MWEIHWTDEFGNWIVGSEVDEEAREDIRTCLIALRAFGPSLGRPLADTVKGSRHPNMKELRVQSNGRPFRIFYAFDPERKAILLIGGNKQGNRRFYDVYIPIADQLFDFFLEELRNEKRKKKI